MRSGATTILSLSAKKPLPFAATFFFFLNFLLDITDSVCYDIKADNLRRVCGCSTMARAPAFQAGDAGSIPVTRSNLFICASSSVG